VPFAFHRLHHVKASHTALDRLLQLKYLILAFEDRQVFDNFPGQVTTLNLPAWEGEILKA